MSKKKIPKASKKRLVVFGTLSIIIILYFLFQLLFYTYKIYDLKKEQSKLDKNYTSLKKDEKELRNEIDKLQDSDYIARYARENYSYSKNGEYIIKLHEEDKSTDEDVSFGQYILNKISNINIDYLYIIYAVIIIVVIIIIKSSKNKKWHKSFFLYKMVINKNWTNTCYNY